MKTAEEIQAEVEETMLGVKPGKIKVELVQKTEKQIIEDLHRRVRELQTEVEALQIEHREEIKQLTADLAVARAEARTADRLLGVVLEKVLNRG